MPGGGGGGVPSGVEERGEGSHQRGLDRLVVLGPHALLAVADAQRPGAVDERVELAYRAREKGDVVRGGEQGSRGRRQAVQLLVEALDERVALRLDQPDRDVDEAELFRCHEVDGTDGRLDDGIGSRYSKV